jgi:hypothetical protein
MGVKEKPDIIDIIERKRLQWYGHVKRMQEERLPKLIMEWIPGKRRKREHQRKTWMEGVRAAMKTRHLEANQWLNRKERCLDSGRRRQLSQDRKDRFLLLTNMRLEGACETCTRLHGIRSQMLVFSYRVQQTLSQFLVFSKVLTVCMFALCFEKNAS